jgi:hypothetical protein
MQFQDRLQEMTGNLAQDDQAKESPGVSQAFETAYLEVILIPHKYKGNVLLGEIRVHALLDVAEKGTLAVKCRYARKIKPIDCPMPGAAMNSATIPLG